MKKKLIPRGQQGLVTKKSNIVLLSPEQKTYEALISFFKHLIPGFTEAANGKKYQAPPRKAEVPDTIRPQQINPMQHYALQANNLTGQQTGLGGILVVNGNFLPIQLLKKKSGGRLIKKCLLGTPKGGLQGTSKSNMLPVLYKDPEVKYFTNINGTNPMWYRFPYPNQRYELSDNDLGKSGEGLVYVTDRQKPGSYLGGTYGGTSKNKFTTPKKFIGSLFNTWELFADSIRQANNIPAAQNRISSKFQLGGKLIKRKS